MDLVPTEILIEILNILPAQAIKEIGRTNREINRICQSERFWRHQVLRDYPKCDTHSIYLHNYLKQKYMYRTLDEHFKMTQTVDQSTMIDWKEYYRYLYANFKYIPVYENNQWKGEIIISTDDNLHTIKALTKRLIDQPKLYRLINKDGQPISKDDPERFTQLTRIDVYDPPFDPQKLSPQTCDGFTYHIADLKQICKMLGLERFGNKIMMYERIFSELII